MMQIIMTVFCAWLMLAGPVLAATARLMVSDAAPKPGDRIDVGLVVDLTEANGLVGAYAAHLNWNPEVLTLVEVKDGNTEGFANPQKYVMSDRVSLSQFHVAGASGSLDLAQFVFDVVGQSQQRTGLNLSFDVLDQASTFVSLLPDLQVQSAQVEVQEAVQPVVPYPVGSVRLSTPISETGSSLVAEVLLDVSGVAVPVGAFEARVGWDASVLKLVSVSDGTTGAFVKPQVFVAENGVTFSNLNVVGETGLLNLLTVIFEVVGASGDSSPLDLSFQILDQAGTFASLLAELQIEPTTFLVGTVAPVDFDANGSVDFSDFLIFAGKFGSKSGEERFDARCDLDGNEAIDFQDFVRFTQAYGASN